MKTRQPRRDKRQGERPSDAEGPPETSQGETDLLPQAWADRPPPVPDSELYRLVVENSRDLIVLIDREARIMFASPSFQTVLGYEPQEVIGLAGLTLVHPADLEVAQTALVEAVTTGKAFLSRIRVRRKDGGFVQMEAAGTAVRDGRGEPDLIMAVVRDIEARAAIEAAERRLGAQYAVARVLAEAPTLEAAAPGILGAVGETLGWDLGAIWRIDQELQVLRCVDVWRAEGLNAPLFEEATRNRTFELGTGLPGRAWASGRPEWIPDVVNDANFPRASVAADEGIHGAFAFPIVVGTKTVGVIEFFCGEVREPDDELLQMVAATGSQIGQFIQRRETEVELSELLGRERAARAEADTLSARFRRLQGITDVAMAHLSLDDLLRDLLGAVRDAVRSDTATMLMVTEDGKNLAVRAVSGDEEEAKGQIRVPVGKGIAGKVASRRRAVIVDDVQHASPYSGFLRKHVKSMVAVPLETAGRLIGVMHAASFRPRRFTEEDLLLLGLVAERAAVGIENARLYEGEQDARRAAEQAMSRTVRLQRVTAALSAALAPAEVARVVIEEGVVALGAVAGLMALRSEDGRTLEILRDFGYPQGALEPLRVMPMEANLPITEAVRTRRPVLLETTADGNARYSGLEAIWPDEVHTLAAIPMLFEGRAVGGFVLRFEGARTLSEGDVEFVLALAAQSGQAVERARLYQAERRARADAEGVQLRLAFLAEAGTILAGSLKLQDSLQSVARLAVGFLSDICLIDLLREDGSIERVVALHADPAKQELTDELHRRFGPDPSGPHPAVEVMRTGQPRFSPVMSEEFLRSTSRDDEHFEIIRKLGFESFISVPLIAGSRSLGALTLVSTDPDRRYEASDVELVADLARRAALAVDNARLYESEEEARRVAQRAAARTVVLQAMTAALSEAVTSSDVADVVIERGFPVLGARAGSVALLQRGRETLRVVKAVGYPDDVLDRWHTFPIDAPVPIADAVRTGEPIILRSPEELKEKYSEVASFTSGSDRAWAAVPMIVEGEVVGAIGISFAEEPEMEEDETSFLLALARQCGQALERTRLYDSEQEARREAEAARSRIVFLAGASQAFSASLDPDIVLENAARLTVPNLADWCVVDLLEVGGTLRQAAVSHVEPSKEALARELRKRYPPDPEVPHVIWKVLTTGESELAPEIRQEDLRARAKDDIHLKLLTELGMRSHLVVPMKARGRTLGVVSLISMSRRYGADDLALAEEFVARAALAVDNARLYQQQLHAARALQRSLLPPTAPEIPGVEVASRYRAVGEGAEVGGDFYDVFEAGDGAWAVVIGDVCGKGPEAAAVTGLARHTIRATAMHEDRPSIVLGQLNRAMLGQVADGRFCTVCYARLRLSETGARLTTCSAGHPLPLVLRADGSVETAGRPGRLLGVFPETKLSDHAVDLHPGDSMILYTDGVTEQAREGIQFGVERLEAVLESSSGQDADGIADAIERSVVRFGQAEVRDDVALLVLRIPPVLGQS